jgi:hypothetical protein
MSLQLWMIIWTQVDINSARETVRDNIKISAKDKSGLF